MKSRLTKAVLLLAVIPAFFILIGDGDGMSDARFFIGKALAAAALLAAAAAYRLTNNKTYHE